jgi:hypothetical protein
MIVTVFILAVAAAQIFLMLFMVAGLTLQMLDEYFVIWAYPGGKRPQVAIASTIALVLTVLVMALMVAGNLELNR